MRGKKLLAAFLGAVMMLGAFPAAAYADELPPQQEQQEQQEPQLPHVPQISIKTENGDGATLEKDTGYVNAAISITDTDGSVLEDSVNIKVRGNTTALSWVKKKAFTFKFDKKKDVLNLGKGKKWVLLANTFDPTLIRNYMANDTARHLGFEYVSGQRACELWLDGAFRGFYTLMTPVQVNKERLDLDLDNGKDFLVELESMNEEEGVYYFKEDGWRYAVKEPEEADEEENEYIKSTFSSIVKILKNGTEEQIREAVDVESFAKYYVLNEYLKTYDFSMSSVYFYYKNGVLYAGPPWDYDLSTGNTNQEQSDRTRSANDPEGIFCDSKNLYKNLCNKNWFNSEVKAVYEANREWFDDLGADGGYADTFRAEYSAEIERNYTEAGWDIGKFWISIQRKPEKNYEDNYQFLKGWLQSRSTWINDYFDRRVFFRKGDADGNGIINVNDATVIQQLVAEADPGLDEAAPLRAQVTGAALSIDDATAVQKNIAELPDAYGVGEMQLWEKEDN